MGTVTVRFNNREEKILKQLQDFYGTDKSKILREALLEKYEDLRDREIIEAFEKRLASGTVRFARADGWIRKIIRRGVGARPSAPTGNNFFKKKYTPRNTHGVTCG